MLRVITPIPAGLHSQAARAKTPPILFDRTPTGEIIAPGGWWGDLRQMAATIAVTIVCHDALLPADTDTIENAEARLDRTGAGNEIPIASGSFYRSDGLPATSPRSGVCGCRLRRRPRRCSPIPELGPLFSYLQ